MSSLPHRPAPSCSGVTEQDEAKLIEDLCDLQIPNVIQIHPDGQNIVYSTSLTWSHAKAKNPCSTIWQAVIGETGSAEKLTSGEFNDVEPRISPDGKKVAFISDRAEAGEHWAIYILDLPRHGSTVGEPVAVTDEANGEEIESIEWSPDSRSILFISPDEKSEEEKAKEEDEDTDAEVFGERWEYARLRLVDVETKTVRCLTPAENDKQKERHVTGACFSHDGKQVAFTSSKTPYMEESIMTGTTFSIYDLATNTIRDVLVFNNEILSLNWTAKNQLFFRSGIPENKTSGGGKAVYTIDLNAAKPKWEHAAHGIDDDADSGLAKLDNGDIAVLTQHGCLETWISLIGSGKVLFKRETVIEAWEVQVKAGSDEAIVVVGVSDVNHPMEVFSTKVKLDASTAAGNDDSLVRLSNHGHAFKDRQFGSCTTFKCPSADNQVELDGVFLSPAKYNEQDKPLPTFVLIHGGPDDRNSNSFDGCYYMWTPYLLSKGYAVLMPQYRGSLGGGATSAKFTIGGTGRYDYDDCITITNHAIELGLVDKNRMVVGGWSQGGFLTYMCITRNGLHGLGWKFRAAVPGAGVSDLDSLPLTADNGATFELECNDGLVPWTMDKSDTRNRRASALWEIKAAMDKTKATGEMVIPPVLILHGENDDRCPYSQAEGFRRALHSYGLPYEFVTYPRQEHEFKEQKFWRDMLSRIGRWCDTHIGQ
ncbi:acylamino-acid-releasing enzyme [Acrodontium crateriforme]|uniref:Dipeptidyl-peptidase V n=1 Tax=Acrodontium crateriforme TaxID=150365 RepID=A0AAQ3R332_9PEZI|nr:acylamino-acid-releasing enzyme [Acrodontium crateriforme]